MQAMPDQYDFVGTRSILRPPIGWDPDQKPKPFLVDRKSSAYFRLMSAGFTIDEGSNVYAIAGNSGEYGSRIYKWAHVYPFTCVCGKTEFLHLFEIYAYRIMNNKIDVAKILEDIGSVGIKHLRDDGYSMQQIREIRRAYV